jgi:catecholate siderophore receptor
MTQPTEAPPTNDKMTMTRVARTMVGVALGTTATSVGHEASAQTADTQLPTVSVQGQTAAPSTGYQTSMPALGKLTQPLLDTPQSISEIPKALLDDQGVSTLRDALRNVPGVSLAAGEGGQQGDNLSIRGFNAQDDIYLDGMHDFGSYYRDPFNLDSVEVLKGPASVLFGRGSTGGAINQVSKHAQLAPVTTGTLSFGTDGTKRSTIDMDRAIPGLQGAAIRLNAMVDEGGVAGRSQAENRRFGIAPSLAFGLGTDTRLKLDYFHQQTYDTPDYGIPWLNGKPAPVSSSNFYGYKDSDHFRTNVDIGTARIEHDFNDNISISNQTRFASYRRDLRVTEPQITTAANGTIAATTTSIIPASVSLGSINVARHDIALTSKETNFDNETDATFHFKTGPFDHTVVTGIEISRMTSDPTRYTIPSLTTNLVNPTQVPFTLAVPVTSVASVVANNYAAFVMDTIKITPQIDVMGGWRFDRYDSTYKQIIAPATYVGRNDDVPTYRAAVVYKPIPNASVYFSYGTSFNPSAEALSLSASTAAVAPEKSRNYEVGGKLDVLDGRLSLTSAIYDLAKTNVRETNPLDATTSILAGNYRVRGFEIGVTGHITDRWQVFGGYSFNDAEVVSSPNVNELHHAPPNAPRHTFSTFTEYKLPWYDIEVGGGVNLTSSRTASSTPVTGTTIIERAPGYVTGQLFAKAPITKTLTAQVNITNVSNEMYYDSLHPGHIILGASRAALFTLTAKL